MTITIKLHVTYISATLNTGKLMRQKSNISTTNPLTILSIILPIAPDMRNTRQILRGVNFVSVLLASCIYTYIDPIRITVVIMRRNTTLPEKLPQAAPLFCTYVS